MTSPLLKREIPVHYHDGLGWIADWPEPLMPAMLQAAGNYVYRVNKDRVLAMVPGPMKERALAALEQLRTGGVRQRQSGTDKFIDVFKSTRRVNPDRTFFFMGEGNG